MSPDFSIVVPTIGRPQLADLLHSLDHSRGPEPAAVVIVDDRRRPSKDRLVVPSTVSGAPVALLRTEGGRGPATARNLGWRYAASEWVAFLDDDVKVSGAWLEDLQADIEDLGGWVAASQGSIEVPLPGHRRPTDWERNVAGLSDAMWATADMAYRRRALEDVGGFDQRFRRAYREDSDLALRVLGAGWSVLKGRRTISHPVRPPRRFVSLAAQAGNADDVLMRSLHGPRWRERSFAGPGRNGAHLMGTGLLAGAVLASLARRWQLGGCCGLGWALATARFFWQRTVPGPGTRAEVLEMAVTSCAIPPLATYHLARGLAGVHRLRSTTVLGAPRYTEAALEPDRLASRIRFGQVPRPLPADPYWAPKALLFDRDGTLIVDRHYLGDPARVTPIPGARAALERVRQAGLATGVVTNQSGLARGLLSEEQLLAVNARVEELLGPFDVWAVCGHSPAADCRCRKPSPGLIEECAEQLGLRPSDCAVVGDIGADVEAAEAAGARAVLVPTRRTRAQEVRRARQVAADIRQAVDLILAGRC